MSPLLAGGLLGLVAGAGAALAVLRMPVLRRPTLEDRLAPYLRDGVAPSRLLHAGRPGHGAAGAGLAALLRPLLREAAGRLGRAVGGTSSVRRRLELAGGTRTVEDLRLEQLAWGALGLAAGLVLSFAALANGSRQLLALLVLCLLCAVTGVLARDRWLSVEVARRERRILAEFPTVAELLALVVTAGGGAVGALERVTRLSDGELARELSRALAEARAGASLPQALEGIAARTSLPVLARFVDGVVIAVERGTPLADVLRAQAVDVREASRRALLETGGRKEIAMMVPVVFLVLPVTVVFALFPGFIGLSFSG